MTDLELTHAILIIGPYVIVELCKGFLGLQGSACRTVNALASTALGAGMGLLVVQGVPLERVIVGAIAAGIAWLTATGTHGLFDRARDALTNG